MTNMKLSKNKNSGMGMPGEVKGKGPEYPYGLCIHIEKEQLDKLGLTGDLPKVGTEFNISAKCVVTSVSQGAAKNSEHASADFQITDMELGENEEVKNKKTAKLMFNNMGK